MPALGEREATSQRPSRAQVADALKKLQGSDAFAAAKRVADEALAAHEQSAIRSQQISEQDLSVRINER